MYHRDENIASIKEKAHHRVNSDSRFETNRTLKREELERLLMQYGQQMVDKQVPKIQDLKQEGKKVVVSDFSLAHWLAQSYQLDICEWPRQKPDNIPKEIYEPIKRLLKRYTQHAKPSKE
jgi:hypothetical protein